MLPSTIGWSPLRLIVLGIGWLFTEPLRVAAQTSDAVCFSQYSWMDNSLGQNPCLVGAIIIAPCFPNGFEVPASSLGYGGPLASQANQCECNTVAYSLVTACGICQGDTYVSWPTWAFNCSSVSSPGVYPGSIPGGTAIPYWAYQDVTISGNFNVTLAQILGDTPESAASTTTSSPSVSPTSSSTVSTTQTSTITPTPSSTITPTSSSKSSDTGLIVGCVVGGIGVIAFSVFCTWLVMRRRRRARNAPDHQRVSMVSSIVSPLTGLLGGPPGSPALTAPSDPSTFTPSYFGVVPGSLAPTATNPYDNPSIYGQMYPSQSGNAGIGHHA